MRDCGTTAMALLCHVMSIDGVVLPGLQQKITTRTGDMKMIQQLDRVCRCVL